jgi:lambda family phage tail tape measure protein
MAENLKVKVTVDTKEAERSLASLQGVVGGLLAALAGREVIQFADSITSLQNKLMTISPSLENATKQFEAITRIAISSRAPLSATGDLYFRIARSADALGISQLEAATITDSLAKAMATTGMSAAEAAGPLLQLGQALQSGRFQGDELRSILEGMPIVAQAMADSLGVTVGKLRELGSQGKLTGDVFVKAMQSSRDSILEAFGKTTPTISQSFEVLKTSAAIAYNEFEKNSEAGRKTGAAIEYLAFMLYKASKDIDQFIEPLAKVIKFLAILLTFTVIGRIIRAIGAAFAYISSTISLAAAEGAAVVAAFRTMVASGKTLGRTIQITATSFFTFFKRIASGFPFMEAMKRLIIALGNRLGYLKPVIAAVATFFGKLGGAIAYVAGAIASFVGVDKIVEEFNSFGDASSDNSKELADFRAEMADFNTGLDETKGSGKALAESQAEIAQKVSAARKEIELQAEAYHRNVAAIKEQIQFQRDQIGISEEQLRVNEAVRDFNKSYSEEERRMQEEIAKLRAKGAGATDEERGQIAELQIQMERLRASRDSDLASIRATTLALYAETQAYEVNKAAKQATMDIVAGGLDFRTQLAQQQQLADAENELVRKKLEMQFELEKTNQQALLELRKKYVGQEIPAVELAALEQIRAVRQQELELNGRALEEDFERRRTFLYGWTQASKDALNELSNTVADQATYARNIFNTITNGFTNSIMKFVETGKLSFKDLFKSLMTEIIKMQMNKLFLSIFGKSGPLGNIFAGLFAEGGRIPSGQFGIVGERGPEIVTGPANVTGTDATAALMGGRGATNITYNIQAVDAMSFKQLVARDPEFIYSVTQLGARRLPR